MQAGILHSGAHMCACEHTHAYIHTLGRLADYFYTFVNKTKSLKGGVTSNGSLNDTREKEER